MCAAGHSALLADSTGKEFDIPKGDICCTSPAFQHRLPSLFKDADQYDHSRFLPPRSEDKAAKFTFVGFGGGRHGCMGTNFAYLQIKTVRRACARRRWDSPRCMDARRGVADCASLRGRGRGAHH